MQINPAWMYIYEEIEEFGISQFIGESETAIICGTPEIACRVAGILEKRKTARLTYRTLPSSILDLPSAVLRRCVLQLSGDRKRHRCNSAQPDVHCRTLAGHCKALCRNTASRLRHLRHGRSPDVL